jgi:hypothetical protein
MVVVIETSSATAVRQTTRRNIGSHLLAVPVHLYRHAHPRSHD